MASRAFVNYIIRHLIQFRYVKIRKEIHRHEKKNLSLLQSDYNRITIGLQTVASSPTHTVQAVPFKKKEGKSRRRKQKTKEKDRMKERKARWK